MPASIELLQPYHDRESFSCGHPVLDDFLRTAAHLAPMRTWVLVAAPGDRKILAFCAMYPDPIECSSEAGLHLGVVDVV